MAWLAFGLGIFLGTFLGVLVIGLCQMAGRRAAETRCEDEDCYVCKPLRHSKLAESME